MATRFKDHILGLDVHSARPAATAVPPGTLYSCSTHNLVYRSDGATWSTWGTLSGGGTPAAHAATHAAAGSDPVALDDSQIAPVAPNDQTGTTYTFVLADGRRMVTASNASAQSYTVPPNSSVAYPNGAVLSIVAKGAGQVTLAPGSGVTLQSAHGLKTSAQWATVSLTKILTDTWVVSGDTVT